MRQSCSVLVQITFSWTFGQVSIK